MRGFRDEDRVEKSTLTDLALHLHHETPDAWLLSDTGLRPDAKWLPKSQAERGSGRYETIWTMPEWIATDRGWV